MTIEVRRPSLCAFAAMAVLLAGCEASFPARKVDLSQADALTQPGIYYALPKTVFDLRVPVEYTTSEGGELRKLEQCWAQYRSGTRPKDSGCEVLLPEPAGLALKQAQIVPRPAPDYAHVYVVEPETWWWYSMSHDFTNHTDGFLSSTSSKGSNEVLPVLASVATELVPYAGAIKGLGMGGATDPAEVVAQAIGGTPLATQFKNYSSGPPSWKAKAQLGQYADLTDDQIGAVKDLLAAVDRLKEPEASLLNACWRALRSKADSEDVHPEDFDLVLRINRSIGAQASKHERLESLSYASVDCLGRLAEVRRRQLAEAEKALVERLKGYTGQVSAAAHATLVADLEQKRLAVLRKRLTDLRVGLRLDASQKKTSLTFASTQPFEPQPAQPSEAPACQPPAASWHQFAAADFDVWPRGATSKDARDALAAFNAHGRFAIKTSAIDLPRDKHQALRSIDDEETPRAASREHAALAACELAAGPTEMAKPIGYRYRLPVQGRVELVHRQLDSAAWCGAVGVECRLPFGAVLPCDDDFGAWCEATTARTNEAEKTPCARDDGGCRFVRPPEGDSKAWTALCKKAGAGCKAKAELSDDVIAKHHSDRLLVDATVPVAQFGPIVALPASFSGKNVNVSLTLTPHGSMSNIKLGQEARDASGLTGVLDAVTAERTKRDEAQKEAAKAAASAPLDALQRTNSLLEAQIKQRQLLQCLDQWKPGEPKPAGC